MPAQATTTAEQAGNGREQAPSTITAALWATNLARPLNGIDAWAAAIDQQMAEAKQAGASILVMPEYCSEQWLSFAPGSLAVSEEIAWMAEQAPAALEAIGDLPRRHDMALLAGTIPWRAHARRPGHSPYVDRAHLMLPDGRVIIQDKLVLTPGEKNPAAWDLSTGEEVTIVEWRGLRLATAVCLDVEMPALACRLAPEELDLLLVPSMTEKLSGYSRVFDCAKARAIELQTTVLAVGCIGAGATGKPRESNTSGAAAYVPCEEVLGLTGIAADLPARDHDDGVGPMLIARDLPIATIRDLRQGKAEVWPGAWSADGITLVRG